MHRKMECVFSNYIQPTRMNIPKQYSVFCCVTVKNQAKVMTSLLKTQLLAFVIAVHANKLHFWNPETKLVNTSMVL